MEGLVLSSSSSSIGGCVVFRRRVTHTHNNKFLLFQQTNKNNLKFNNKNHFQRGPFVVVALSGNTQEPQQEQEDEDEDEDNHEQEEEPLASFVALSANPEQDDEDEDDQVTKEDEQVETKPTQQQVVAATDNNAFAAAVSTPLDHPTTSQDTITPLTTNSSLHGTTTSTRAGLFRTPISGGVQSATSVHDLPPPPLAVRNLMEQARFAHLCTVMSRMHHRREGYPFGSLVDFATDAMGHPIFSFSPLAIHTRNLLADPRCTLVVQIPGWSGLSNARVTIFGDVFPLPEDQQEWAHQLYIAKHHQGPSHKWGNFYYFRMQNISDIYFIGGFGTVAWVNVSEYEALRPDKIAVDGGEQNLKELNAIFSKPIKELLSLETEVDDAALISIDSKGTDVRVRQGAQFNIQRLAFEEGHGVETLEEAKAALWNLIHKGGGLKLDHKF